MFYPFDKYPPLSLTVQVERSSDGHLCPEMNPVAKFTNFTIFRYARAKIKNFTFFSCGDAKIADFPN